MGLAEITPGISGATVAGLFNVYNEFVRIISFFSPSQFEFSFKKIKEKYQSRIFSSTSFGHDYGNFFSCKFNKLFNNKFFVRI